MLTFNDKQMAHLAALRRSSGEVPTARQVVREHATESLDAFSDALLDQEVRATLARCDELGLTSDTDRMQLCLLELTLFPGLRDLPKLQGLLNYAEGPADARLAALFLVAPPWLWRDLLAGAPAVRQQRGWPT